MNKQKKEVDHNLREAEGKVSLANKLNELDDKSKAKYLKTFLRGARVDFPTNTKKRELMKLFFREDFDIDDYTAYETREKERLKREKESKEDKEDRDDEKQTEPTRKRKIIGIPTLAREATDEFNDRRRRLRSPKPKPRSPRK